MMQTQLPSGLAALMPQAAPQIPPGLLKLIQTTEQLKSMSQPVVPETGQPTVAAQAAQAVEQMVQPPQPPEMSPPQESQPGMEALMPGVQQRAMEMAQAAQPATQGDIQKAMAQRNPMQGGIGGLPGDISAQGMAEGGVVGYNGKNGSEVKSDQAKEDRDKIMQLLRDMRDKGLIPAGAAIADVASLIPRGLAGAYNSTIVRGMRAAGLPAAYLPDVAGGDFSSMTPFYDRYARQPEAVEAAPPPETAPQAMRTEDAFANPRIDQPTVGRAPSPAPAPSGQKRPAANQAVAPAPRPSEAKQMFERALAAQARLEIPRERSAQDIRTEREDFYRASGIDPDFAKARLQALAEREAEDKAAAAARAKQQEGRGLENLISFMTRAGGAGSLFRGLAQASQGMEQVTAQQRKEDEAFRLQQRNFRLESEKERNALDDMKRALADGDISGATKSRDAALAARNAKNAAEAQLRGQFAPEMLRSETADADRVQRALAEAARLRQQAEANSQTKLASAIAANQSRLISANKEVENILQKKYKSLLPMFSMMTPKDLQEQPKIAEAYENYVRDKADLDARIIKPVEAEMNRLAVQVGGGNITRYDAQGNRAR